MVTATPISSRGKPRLDDDERVRKLLGRIETAGKEEEKWRKECDRITRIYRDEDDADTSAFTSKLAGGEWNVLASNVNIMVPATFNSRPIPDIRRRYSDTQLQEVERDAAEVLERALDIEMEDDRWMEAVFAAVSEMTMYGRGVVRMRYMPEFAPLDRLPGTLPEDSPPKGRGGGAARMEESAAESATPGEQITRQSCPLEVVTYADFRRGPGKTWRSVKWIAFRHLLGSEELERMFGQEMAERIPLDQKLEGVGKEGQDVPRDLLRAEVWEMWDKPSKTVIFLNDAIIDGYLRKPEPDPLGLEGFYPIPRPVYADTTNTSLVPLSDYRLYRKQAKELEIVSGRISAIVRIIKWRGAYDEALQRFAELVDAGDGKLVPVQMPGPGAKLDESVWLWPIEQAVAVLQQLVSYRTELKAQIFEILGLWDIIRGASNPNETLGAQQLKTQWGSLRIVLRQAEVQRLCKDLIAMQCECIGEHYDPQYLTLMTGIQVTPQVKAMITSDQLRLWMIDIETDSTIKADMSGAREEISQFVMGLSQFIAGIGPAVQAGFCPPDVAIDLLGAFAGNFKLGRSADMALTRWSDEAKQAQEQKAAAAQQPPQPSPEQMAAQQQAAEAAAKAQTDQQKAQQDAAAAAAKAHVDQGHLELEQQRVQLQAAKQAHERQMAEAEMQLKVQTAAQQQQAQQAQPVAPDQAAAQFAPVLEALGSITQTLQAATATLVQAAQTMAAPPPVPALSPGLGAMGGPMQGPIEETQEPVQSVTEEGQEPPR